MGRMSNDRHRPAAISARLVSLSADSEDPPGINDHDGIAESAVAPDTPRELMPDDISDTRRFRCFLFFVLQAD